MVAVIQALVVLAVAVRRWPSFRHLVARKPLPAPDASTSAGV